MDTEKVTSRFVRCVSLGVGGLWVFIAFPLRAVETILLDYPGCFMWNLIGRQPYQFAGYGVFAAIISLLVILPAERMGLLPYSTMCGIYIGIVSWTFGGLVVVALQRCEWLYPLRIDPKRFPPAKMLCEKTGASNIGFLLGLSFSSSVMGPRLTPDLSEVHYGCDPTNSMQIALVLFILGVLSSSVDTKEEELPVTPLTLGHALMDTGRLEVRSAMKDSRFRIGGRDTDSEVEMDDEMKVH